MLYDLIILLVGVYLGQEFENIPNIKKICVEVSEKFKA
jgi:hypothetical protein